jgi:hypothetical protein
VIMLRETDRGLVTGCISAAAPANFSGPCSSDSSLGHVAPLATSSFFESAFSAAEAPPVPACPHGEQSRCICDRSSASLLCRLC